DYNATYDVINVYSGDDENQECEINEKCRNKSDDVEYSDDMIIKAGNHWLDNLKAKVDQLLEEIDATWKKDNDNSIRLLTFWLNLASITLNSYSSLVVKQSIE
ncbi:18715_t:CDS:2, partial [Gigaspora rosea]